MDQSTSRTESQQAALQILLEAGAELVQLVLAQARAQAAATPEAPLSAAVRDYDRAARAVRRNILLAQHLEKPARTQAPARRQIIRTVEDAIHREAPDDEPGLRSELLDRLDRLELAEDLDAARPVPDIIAEIVRDLGLAASPGLNDPWKRRRPADLAVLQALAATPPGRTPAAPTAHKSPHQPAAPPPWRSAQR